MTNYFPLLVAISSAFGIGVIGNAVHERAVQDELPAAVNGIRATRATRPRRTDHQPFLAWHLRPRAVIAAHTSSTLPSHSVTAY
jgi:hypothetical protein